MSKAAFDTAAPGGACGVPLPARYCRLCGDVDRVDMTAGRGL